MATPYPGGEDGWPERIAEAREVREEPLSGPSSCGRGYGAGQAGVSNPPSPTVSGALPTSLGISPVIGPPLAAAAGVVSVRSAPSVVVPTQRNGVMPCTWATAGAAGSTASPPAIASATRPVLSRLRTLPP